MITTTARLCSRLALRNSYRFSNSYDTMKSILARNLYSIEMVNQQLSRKILAMLYSPGVGAVCENIENDPSQAETLTLRARSVAVVTDGSFIDATGAGVGVGPALDWVIAQIKYYSGLDAFPFIVDPEIDLEDTLKDFSTSYGTVLLLDKCQIPYIPKDLLVVSHQDILAKTKTESTDCQKTASVLAYLIKHKKKGLIKKDNINNEALNFQGSNFYNYHAYSAILKDGRDIYRHALDMHEFFQGKIKVEVNFHDIQMIKKYFTEQNLKKITKEEYPYSKTSRLAACVTDGTAVLGYGNIGPRAGLPVMEGKSLLFKLLGDVQVVPISIHPRQSVEEQVSAISKLLGNFEGINLEDIKAPECFAIEEGLNALKKLPVFHDDQHGTAIVVLAGLINAVKVVGKDLKKCKIVVNGAGAAGIAIVKLLLHYGVTDIVCCDSKGAIYKGREKGMNSAKKEIAEVTNLEGKKGKLSFVIPGADIFVGVSTESALRGHEAAKMASKSIIFALANPFPEILPHDAKSAGAWVYGSGRSDFQNQINDSLAFPGIFRAITEHRIKVITDEMKVRAAEAIAHSIDGKPTQNFIIPDSLQKDLAIRISDELGQMFREGRSSKVV